MTTRRNFLQVSGVAAGCAFLPGSSKATPPTSTIPLTTALDPNLPEHLPIRRPVLFLTRDMSIPPIPPAGTLVSSASGHCLFTVEKALPVQMHFSNCDGLIQCGVAEVTAISIGEEYENCWINKVIGSDAYFKITDLSDHDRTFDPTYPIRVMSHYDDTTDTLHHAVSFLANDTNQNCAVYVLFDIGFECCAKDIRGDKRCRRKIGQKP